jgi:hypothetical protein
MDLSMDLSTCRQHLLHDGLGPTARSVSLSPEIPDLCNVHTFGWTPASGAAEWCWPRLEHKAKRGLWWGWSRGSGCAVQWLRVELDVTAGPVVRMWVAAL